MPKNIKYNAAIAILSAIKGTFQMKLHNKFRGWLM